MKHDHPRLPLGENKTRVGVYSVQAAKICTFGKDYKCMDPRAFCTSQMCVQIERLLQKVTNCEGFCQDLAVGIAGVGTQSGGLCYQSLRSTGR